MPALPFQKNLRAPIRKGTKPGTVRQVRLKNPIKVGDTLYLYTGMRTKQCKKFGERICKAVYPISIDCIQKKIWIDGIELYPIIRKYFTERDINGTEQQFFDFFNKQKYARPLVWIVWEQSEVYMWDEWLNNQPTKKGFAILEVNKWTQKKQLYPVIYNSEETAEKGGMPSPDKITEIVEINSMP